MFLRSLIFFLPVLFFTGSLAAQTKKIAEARTLPAGTSVTVRGRVTNGPELGRTRYLQDGTAGIAAFPGKGSLAGFERTLKPGDSVEVSGILEVYHNLLEISPVQNFRVIVPARSLPKIEPRAITVADIGSRFEGQLVRIDSLHFTDRRDTFSGNASFGVTDLRGRKSKVYLPPETSASGAPLPDQPLQLVAIVSRYEDYQLLPLNLEDHLPVEWQSAVRLDSATVTSVLRVINCSSGKIALKDENGKERLFALAHSSGTTPIDVSTLPSGAYVAEIRTGRKVTKLPFQKN